jgi:hydrogenase assembly chaperone HypC/HupF
MCLDFPGQIVAREGELAVVDSCGHRRRATTLLFPDIAVDDWVYVAAGTIVERLDPLEAEQITSQLHLARGVTS